MGSTEKQETNVYAGRELRNVLVLSGSFTAVFTAYLAIQNLQSSLNQEQGLGLISLSCLYACIIISGILAPVIIKILGGRLTLVVPFICHVIYTATNFYPTLYTLIPASLILGIPTGSLWTYQCMYISEMSYSYARTSGEDVHAVLSKFNGIFFSMFETTQITGNLISSLVLHQGTNNNESASNETIRICGKDDCPLEANATKIETPDRHVVYILLGIFLVCDMIGVILAAWFLPPLKQQVSKQKPKVVKSLTTCAKGLSDVNLALLVPLIVFMAMEQGILWTDYTKVIINCY